MSVTSIGSTFSTPTPTIVASPVAASARERIVAPAKESDGSGNDTGAQAGERRFPAQLGSAEKRQTLGKTSLGALMLAQEEAMTKPRIAARDGAKAYGGA